MANTEIDAQRNKSYAESSKAALDRAVKYCVIMGEDKIMLPRYYLKCASEINKFIVRDDDTFIAGFPRSGTTWLQELVWLIKHNLDYEAAKKPINDRIPLLELDSYYDTNDGPIQYVKNDLIYINKLKAPRVIKTHLHWSLLPEDITSGRKNPKIIYILRNPKDVCSSYLHLYKLSSNFTATLEDFSELFLRDQVVYGPFWKSVLSFWKQRSNTNILFVRYMDMIEDIHSVITNVAAFLDKCLTSQEIIDLAEHLSFTKMKNNLSINPGNVFGPVVLNSVTDAGKNFIRNGKQCGYLSEMSVELIKRFDVWTKKQLYGCDLVVE